MKYAILKWATLFGGVAIITASFFIWGNREAVNIFYLNLLVSLFAYTILHLSSFSQWIGKGKEEQKSVASLGMKLTFTILYTILVFTIILLGKIIPELTFKLQLIIQCVLLLFFLFVVMGIIAAGDRASKTQESIDIKNEGKNNIKAAINQLNAKIYEKADIDTEISSIIKRLTEDIRFLSPSSNSEAVKLEKDLIDEIKSVEIAFSNYELNKDRIHNGLKKAEFLFQSRKNIYN
ncbi:MAG: hypothetical protein IKW05_00530 [Muribaculaceae bacterium]|nr:hypothetical protein [Muribaculaceae bacterium]